MFVGHYSAAFVAKAVRPKVPLWLLFLAVQFVDVFWSLFILLGVEKARIVASLPSNPLDLHYMPYTHSLLGAFLWSALAVLLVRLLPVFRLPWSASLVVGVAVFSHWLLDFLVHRPDLALTSTHKVGLGLWNFPIWAFLLEIILFSASVLLFLRFGCPAANRRRVLLLAGAMVCLQAIVSFGPAPHHTFAIASSVFVLFMLLAAAAYKAEALPAQNTQPPQETP